MGQDFPMPQLGHQFSEGLWDLHDTIILVISHSGGTFGPLAVSNLMQSVSPHIFVVTSEWDTQIGKQLREIKDGFLSSRIFSTNMGMRPAEPCSATVAASHQMLTQLFGYMASSINSDFELRVASGSVISQSDIMELERCNIENIAALEEIVGCTREGEPTGPGGTDSELRAQGAKWTQHVLETPRAWMCCATYVAATVIAGYPLVGGIATLCGADFEKPYVLYPLRVVDALIYIFLPQIFILLIRLCQGRTLLHRMVGRTIVIGDCPWVAQCAEAFLSKVVATTYSATGITVFSGNPADHLAHKMTHRVVRGTLLACGRPDGRLMALTSLENAVNLSVNQASSIQSLGATCESITIGHNPSKLPLTKNAIFLKGRRPDYLCERLINDVPFSAGAAVSGWMSNTSSTKPTRSASSRSNRPSKSPSSSSLGRRTSTSGLGPQAVKKARSSAALLGEYSNLAAAHSSAPKTLADKLQEMEDERLKLEADENHAETSFMAYSTEVNGVHKMPFKEFIKTFQNEVGHFSGIELHRIFVLADKDEDGFLCLQEWKELIATDFKDLLMKLDEAAIEEQHGLANIEPSGEEFFGRQLMQKAPAGMSKYKLAEAQRLSMQLYETRIASLQRAVAFFVMFHEIGYRVQNFWSGVSCGLLGYRMDRTHSIMRIATTASPVSGADVRGRMADLSLEKEFRKFGNILIQGVRGWHKRKAAKLLKKATQALSAANSLNGVTNAMNNVTNGMTMFKPTEKHNNTSMVEELINLKLDV